MTSTSGRSTGIVDVAESDGRWDYTDLNFAPREPSSGPDQAAWRQVAPLPSARSGLAATVGGGDGQHVYYRDVMGSVTALRHSAGAAADEADTRVFTACIDAPVAVGGSAVATTAGRGPRIYYLDHKQQLVALAEWESGGWEYLPCTRGPRASAVGRLAATGCEQGRHVYYLDAQSHLVEASWVGSGDGTWSVTGLTSALPSPPPSPVSPLAALSSGSGLRRVYYLDQQRRPIELTYSIRHPDRRIPEASAGWKVTDLSAWAGAPPAAPGSPLTAALVDDDQPHVYYRGDGGDLIELAWLGAGWQTSTVTGVPRAAATSALAVALTDDAHRRHLFYLDPKQQLIHLHRNGRDWQSTDLSTRIDLPTVARSSPLAATGADGLHVYYLSEE